LCVQHNQNYYILILLFLLDVFCLFQLTFYNYFIGINLNLIIKKIMLNFIIETLVIFYNKAYRFLKYISNQKILFNLFYISKIYY